MRILFFLLISVASFGQIPLWQLEYAPDSMKVIGAAADGEPIWVNKGENVKVKDTPTMKLRIISNTIRADIKKRLNAGTVGGSDKFLYIQYDSTGQITAISELLSDDFDKDPFNEFQSLVIDSVGRRFTLGITDGNEVSFIDQVGITDTTYINQIISDSIAAIVFPRDSLYTNGDPGHISIIGGNEVDINVNDADSNPYNELQTISIIDSTDRVFQIRLHPENQVISFRDSVGLTEMDTSLINQLISDSLATYVFETDTSLINQLISDSLATINQDQIVSLTGAGITNVTGTYPNFTVTSTEVDGSTSNEIQELQTSGSNDVNLQITGGGGTGVETTLTNVLIPSNGSNGQVLTKGSGTNYDWQSISLVDSTNVLNSYGTIITESPANTWNIKVDSTKFVTPYDLTLIPNPPDSTSVSGGYGINVTEVSNVFTVKVDTSEVVTPFDINGMVKGTGAANKVAYWTGANTQSFNNNFHWDNVNGRLGIGNVSPTTALHVNGGITQNFPLNSGLINTNIGTNMNSAMTGTYNIAIGQNNLNANTTGSANFAAGQSCLINNTTGIYNFASGLNSLFSNLGGQYNFSVGRDNLYSNISGNSNFAVGQNNLYLNTTGTVNFAVGFGNLYSNINGSYNFSEGQQNLYKNTNGSYNFAVGLNNLFENTTGIVNFTSGQNNMYFNQNGSYNFGVGQNSLYSNTGGNYNFASGLNNLYKNTNGSYNFAVGLNNLFENTTGNYNVALPRDALRLNESGSDNIAIGNQAGYNSLGSRNIYLGFAAGGGETGSNTLYITHTLANTSGIFGDFANGRFGFNQPPSALTRTLDINGEVRIRDLTTTTPTVIMAADATGVVSSLGLSGLSITGGNLVGAAPLSGTTGAIPYFTSTTELGSTPFTYNSNIMTIPTGNSIYFPGTATIIDKNNSGGSAGEFLSRAASGGGMDWVAAPSLSEVDGSVTNEGILGVSAGSGTTAVITSNTSGATGVTLAAGSNISISESTSTNGGTITIAGSFSEVDGSITNEGYTGVRAGGATSSILQGYNSAGTATGTGTTINASGSISISETTSANGGQITLSGDYGAFTVAATTGGSGLVGPLDGDPFLTFTAGSGMTITRSGTTGDNQTLTFASTGGATNLSYSTKSGTDVTLESSTGADVIFRDGVGTFVNRVSANVIKYDVDEIYGQLSNTAIIASTTIDGVYRSVDFTVPDESFASIIDAKTASDEIEVLVAGTYEIHYSLSYVVPSNRDVRWRIYKNTADIGYIGELTTTFTASHPSKTFNIALAANDKISLRFLGVNGVSGTIDINSPVLKVRRIK